MTTDRDQRVDDRVAAQSAPVTAAHPVRERRRDERRTTDQNERVGDGATARVTGHGAGFAAAVVVGAGVVPDVVAGAVVALTAVPELVGDGPG